VDPEDQWQTIQARPGLKDLRAQAWDRVSLSPDGMTLTVYFYGGVEGCYGLSEVRVTRTAGGVATVTVITGTLPALGDMACIDIAVAYKTTVQLDQPLIIDGAAVDVR
jgi:D-serine deaminase-like pyridoxal phosphate-dependent protein